MSLDPIETTKAITKRYNAYLATSFNLKDPDLKKQFDDELKDEKFVKGPILEITPPFESGKTIGELIDEGILSAEFKKLNTKALPLDRPLYRHQESGILKNVLENENIIVATGTGSGKTETFMIPILNYLFRQKEKSELTPGVRALLLYPMNALANDQLKRIRKLLVNYPDISFGRYTGETLESQKRAEEMFVKMYGEKSLPNERVSREEMKKNPPHILLTNYAMLEYLMLRPEDHIFFDGEYADNWKFIVIDEAHTYNGAKGIEMGMLLRRLKERVVQSDPNQLKCIATSATLGSGNNKLEAVSHFALELFGETFGPKCVIEASRIKEIHEASWGVPSPELYCKWKTIISTNKSSDIVPLLVKVGRTFGIPDSILERAKLEAGDNYNKFLYYTLKDDGNLISLRTALEVEPQSLEIMAEEIFPEIFNSKIILISLVELAVRAKLREDEKPLIPARYHLFVRDIEGAYLSLKPEYKLYLERREHLTYEDVEYPVFEIASCRNCGRAYLVGEIENEVKTRKFKQPGAKYFEDSQNLKYFLLLENVQTLPDNEDESTDFSKKDDLYNLCGKCGAIEKINKVGPICGCGEENYVEILKVESPKGLVHKCPACSKTNSKNSIVFRFLLGRDAVASVLATSLYQQIPAKNISSADVSEQQKEKDDEWTSSFEPLSHNLENCGDNRQLLIFSDSRQDAAFFAPYLNRTYSQILRRRLILDVIKKNIDKIEENRWRIQDLIPPLKQQVRQLNLFPEYSMQEVEDEVWRWMLHELLGIDGKISLEGMGCLGFKLVKPENWSAPRPLMGYPWNLSEDEVWILYQILLDGFRKYGSIVYPEPIDPADEFFEPVNQNRYFRANGALKSKNIFSWIPSTDNHLNTRMDFVMRLAQTVGAQLSKEECRKLLENIWNNLGLEKSGSSWSKFFSSINLKGEGVVYKIRYNFWELKPGINKKEKWYYCEKCSNLTQFNLKGICPTYRCNGTLQECDPDEIFKENHYRILYNQLLTLRMWAEEHTAQLTSKAAAELQTQFIKGEVNVLSCSTTFELGVDVGELESVFMRNVPPSASNYIQRAGRAGRRTDSTAFVLTFCKRSPHDLAHFCNPTKLVSGEIKPPSFEILNEKIVMRHIYATALAEFWKKNPSTFKSVESFFFSEGKRGPELLKVYLDSRPKNLSESLYRIIPQSLHKKLKLDEWGWTEGLYDPKEGVLLKARDEIETDVNSLLKIMNTLRENNKPSDFILRHINTIKKRSLLDALSNYSVIPKYGFPVDVVELQILSSLEEASNLELNRDLRVALAEYAPGSQVVAGGKLWTSRYLKRLPQREWPKYRYAVCDNCQRYQRVLADSDKKLDFCDSCYEPIKGRLKGTFIVPEFGFITSSERPQKVGESRPERTYSTRSYYSGESDKDNERIINLKNNISLKAISASHGRMGVINCAGYQRFKVCSWCGYTILGNAKVEKNHENVWGSQCSGPLTQYDLGHEYMTDILQLQFEGYSNNKIEFWYSLLYAILEGASNSLDIDRQDIDGCLHPISGDRSTQSILLFDDVPGGAGHVKRIIQDENTIIEILKCTLSNLKNCNCGGENGDASCYGCLRNYRNQFCHDQLKRGTVIKFLEENIPD